MPRRSLTLERLDGLVYDVQELERQHQHDREILAGILDKVDELHDAVTFTLSSSQRSQPRISTALEEAAVQLENKRAMAISEQHQGLLRQGELFS